MLTIQSFTFNPFAENMYLIIDSTTQECLIVDPGMMTAQENKVLDEYLSKQQLTPKAIINTHAHIDHILGVQWMKDKYGIPFILHKKEESVLASGLQTATMYGLPLGQIPAVNEWIEDETNYTFNGEEMHILFTPGHSPGSISFYYPAGKWVVSGDVLFQESIGRTDLPGGDFETLKNSIQQKLYTLPEETLVYAGHGAPTTIAHEKQFNPFVRP